MTPSAPLHLDCRGMMCPLPIVELSKAARGLEPGTQLTIEGDDPALPADLQAWCSANGHCLRGLEGRGAWSKACIELA